MEESNAKVDSLAGMIYPCPPHPSLQLLFKTNTHTNKSTLLESLMVSNSKFYVFQMGSWVWHDLVSDHHFSPTNLNNAPPKKPSNRLEELGPSTWGAQWSSSWNGRILSFIFYSLIKDLAKLEDSAIEQTTHTHTHTCTYFKEMVLQTFSIWLPSISSTLL